MGTPNVRILSIYLELRTRSLFSLLNSYLILSQFLFFCTYIEHELKITRPKEHKVRFFTYGSVAPTRLLGPVFLIPRVRTPTWPVRFFMRDPLQFTLLAESLACTLFFASLKQLKLRVILFYSPDTLNNKNQQTNLMNIPVNHRTFIHHANRVPNSTAGISLAMIPNSELALDQTFLVVSYNCSLWRRNVGLIKWIIFILMFINFNF